MSNGQLNEEQIRQAEDYAMTRGISIDEALVFLNMLDYETLGTGLAKILGKPYQALLTNPPPDSAKAKVPLKFAERWKIFPIDYDQEKNILTLALDDPQDQTQVEKLRTIFPAPLQLTFTVASRSEIDKAIEVHYKGKAYVPAQELELPQDFTIVSPEQEPRKEMSLEDKTRTQRKILLLEPDFARAGALKTLLHGEGYSDVNWASTQEDAIKICEEKSPDLLLVNGRTFDSQVSWLRDISQKFGLPHISFRQLAPILLGQEYPYHQMSQALMSLVVFLMKRSMKGEDGQLQEILARARYCKLLALRLNLPPRRVDGLVLSAWLSANKFGKKLMNLIATPYRLDKILNPDADEDHTKGVEVNILKLVTKYQIIKSREPEATKDINQVRRLLGQQTPSPETKPILEAFLQLIKDEEFLRKVDHPSRRILIVDPSESQESSMVLRLENDGYDLEVLADAKSAVKTIMNSGVDLVISEINLPETDGLRFCRALRENTATAPIPFLFLTAEEGERLAAESLEAGADDFLKKPVDLELLALKIQRILASQSPHESKTGVSGSLTEMNITDIIQSLTAGDKDVELTLDSMGEKGRIYIQQGEIVHALTGSAAGEEAFYKLMAWEEGNFQIVSCSDFPPRTIQAGAMSLLMEGARLADEAGGEIEDEDL
ncbi:MAG: response regulator [Desulfobacteraceae bacterium]|nr:MAG: response regulator [Desulfobacteraceae bacterium]